MTIKESILSAGYHSIRVKLIDSNGLESNIFRSQDFLIIPPPTRTQTPPPSTVPIITQSPPPLTLTLTETIINGVVTFITTYIPVIDIKHDETERTSQSSLTAATYILIVTICLAAFFIITGVGLTIYRRMRALDSSDFSSKLPDHEIDKDKVFTVVVEAKDDEVSSSDIETLKNIKDDDIEYMFASSF